MTFAEDMIELSSRKHKLKLEKKLENINRRENIKHQKFLFLTDKYFDSIVSIIKRSSNYGYRKVFHKFDKNDFKANFRGLGYPNEFIKLWLDELTDYESGYLPVDEENQTIISLQGIDHHVVFYNNNNITIKFQW
jgi:cyclopropane fatty-acyl-phospholipid synthase-like methyltransferase|tara:strand:+ start:11083 stop:11487 length:405 start_codon:yes stop_codon:yes gene_type:complete